MFYRTVMRATWSLLPLLLLLSGGCYTDGGGAVNASPRKGCRCPAQEMDSTRRDAGWTPTAGGTVTIRIESEPGILLSAWSTHPTIADLVDGDVLEGLVTLSRDGDEPAPALAERWELDDEGTTWTFFLTEALWHDGTPFSAADVAFTFEQILDPAGGSVLRPLFADVAQVRAVDDHTATIRLDRPRRGFIADLSRVMLLPAHLLRNKTIVSSDFARAPVGTGPFRFADWKKGESISLLRADTFRGERPFLDGIVFRVVEERRVAAALFAAGELDIVRDSGRLQEMADGFLLAAEEPFAIAWVTNTRSPVFGGAKERRALSMLIDREAIRCSIRGCLGRLLSGLPDRPATKESFRPAEARALLQKAGWRDSDGDGVLDRGGRRFSFTLLLPDDDAQERRAATVVQADLRRWGIAMNVKIVSRSVHMDRLRTGRFDASVLSISTGPPFSPAPLFHSRGKDDGSNFGAFADAETDRLIDAIDDAPDRDARRALQESLAARLEEQAPLTVVLRPFAQLLVRRRIHGVHPDRGGLDKRRLWMDGGAP